MSALRVPRLKGVTWDRASYGSISYCHMSCGSMSYGSMSYCHVSYDHVLPRGKRGQKTAIAVLRKDSGGGLMAQVSVLWSKVWF